jgi:hypothetical protein
MRPAHLSEHEDGGRDDRDAQRQGRTEARQLDHRQSE